MKHMNKRTNERMSMISIICLKVIQIRSGKGFMNITAVHKICGTESPPLGIMTSVGQTSHLLSCDKESSYPNNVFNLERNTKVSMMSVGGAKMYYAVWTKREKRRREKPVAEK